MSEEVVKYIGCIGVKTTMRSLKHCERSEVAQESINRLCRANNIFRQTANKSYSDFRQMLDDEPNLREAGKQVRLFITSTHINVICHKSNRIIVQHEMPNVSFASSGNGTQDFVAYVAKDEKFGRACFVFECGPSTGKSVLDTIAREFHMRTKQILYNTNPSRSTSNSNHERLNSGCANLFQATDFRDTSTLNSPLKTNNENANNEDLIAETRACLEKEHWFHGSYLSREESETRLKYDGDFLVRESMLDPGHFVLSVMQDGSKLHLLFDSMGQVKTKEMVFDDISHLIKYHHNHGVPIVADNRIVYLRNGVRPNSKSRPKMDLLNIN